MKNIERIGVSLEKGLLCDFDKLIAEQGYQNRSEAIRDLIRRELSSEQLENPRANAIAAVCMVYDHHAAKLMQKVTDIQHTKLLQVICSTHIHLDAHDCMEIIVLKGKVGQINKTAKKILSQKGVKLGRISLISTQHA